MNFQTEINGFVIFHFCLLATSLSKPLTAFSELEVKASALFKDYNTCWPLPQEIISLTNPLNNTMMERIPNCLEFNRKTPASYCKVSSVFLSILASASSKNMSLHALCNKLSFRDSLAANVAQLKVLVTHPFCFPPPQREAPGQNEPTSNAEKRIYFWWVFQRYEQCMKQLNEDKAKPPMPA